MEKITIKTDTRNEMLDITTEVQSIVSKANVKDGIAVIHIPHTTAAVTINENADPDVKIDMLEYLLKLIPDSPDFRHSEGNSDSHIKSSLTGCDQTVIINDGKLLLGTWQSIYFCEFDGPRNRHYYVKIMEG